MNRVLMIGSVCSDLVPWKTKKGRPGLSFSLGTRMFAYYSPNKLMQYFLCLAAKKTSEHIEKMGIRRGDRVYVQGAAEHMQRLDGSPESPDGDIYIKVIEIHLMGRNEDDLGRGVKKMPKELIQAKGDLL